MSIEQTLFNNMSNAELINHIGWNAPPLVQCLADRLDAAEAALQAHGKLFEKIAGMEEIRGALWSIKSDLEGVEVSDDAEDDYILWLKELDTQLNDLSDIYNEIMEIAE